MEVFMDDFMVYVDSFAACIGNLSKVLTRCIATNLVLNFEKCYFMVTEEIVLGHLVSNRGIEVNKSKIDIITSLPNPTSVWEVCSFLGHARSSRRFIKNFMEFKFDQPCVEAFQELKNQLTFVPILQAPNWNYPFELMYDASNSTLGAILGQKGRTGKPVHMIAYVSSTMDLALLNYITTEKELLEIVFALETFRSYLLGSKIIEFNIEIKDKKGVENFVVDHLSWIERESDPMPIQDEFPDEQLLHINTPPQWFADILNILTIDDEPSLLSYGDRRGR
ncbi:Retrovirus-related Pol polyprotein from transposon 17.6, partial [Mucuna pruriens]